MNAISFLSRNASKYPDKVGFIFEDKAYTYRQVLTMTLEVANHLRQNGIRPGDKVCTMFYNSIEQVCSYFSTMLLGAVNVPINFRSVGPEITYVADNSDAKAIVYGEEFSDVINEVRDGLANVKFSMVLNLADKGKRSEFAPLTKESAEAILKINPQISEEAFILYTSGTTGKPKGAVLTHNNMLWNQTRLISHPYLRRDEVMINPLPFFHSASVGRFLSVMVVGGTIISWKKFDAARIMAAIEKYRTTFIIMVPAMARMAFELQNVDRMDLSSVRYLLLTAATVPVPLKKQALGFFRNAQILDGYGLTENSSAVTMMSGNDVFERPASVGLPDCFTEVRIVDDEFKEVAANVVGQIAVRGPNIMKGYYKNPEATAEAIRDGWLMTGDLGRKDEDGYLYVVGRKKDMIISGGENVYPAEVESILDSHPKIQESAVIGIPHSKWGETVMAFLVLKPGEKITEAEVEEFCRGKLARYKRPTIVRITDALVKNASGKILKQELRKMHENG